MFVGFLGCPRTSPTEESYLERAKEVSALIIIAIIY